MNKKLAATIICILFPIIAILIYNNQETKQQVKQETKVEIKTFPKFSLLDTLGKPFTNVNLEKDKLIVVVHFGNFCHYCHKEAKIMSHYSEEYKDFQLLFVTKDKMDNINKFMNKHKLKEKLNLTVLRYENNEFEEVFGSRSLPCVFIFDKHLKLVQHFDGAVTARTLIKYTRAATIR